MIKLNTGSPLEGEKLIVAANNGKGRMKIVKE